MEQNRAQSTDTLREALKSFPEFTHRPLPSATSIRLLEINLDEHNLENRDKSYSDGYSKDIIVCSLHVADLDDRETPTLYDALSYTWGNPFSIFRSKEDAEKSNALYATKAPIMCNGMVLYIGRNLYEALLSIRMTRRVKAPLSILSPLLGSGPMVKKFIWIDAICIDQENLIEQNSQVQIMDRIYKAADTVHIWLGPQDDFSMDASKVIDVLERAPSGSLERLELSSDLHSLQSQELGIAQIKPTNWHCLFAFLERRWFRRAWIVQEVTFSKFALLNVGSVYFPWSKLVSATQSLRGSIALSTIWNNGVRMSSRSTTSQTPMYLDTSVISSSQILEINPVAIIHVLANTRASHGLQDPLFQYFEFPKLVSPLEILTRFRASQCQNPRDRVYAFLSLWPGLNKLSVDYSRTVAQVFTDAAWAILKSSGNLSLLSHVTKQNGTRTPGLPSWVPDWSCGTSFHAFEHLLRVAKQTDGVDGMCPYKSCGDLEWQRNSSSDGKPNLLKIQGKKIGTVQASAKFDRTNLKELFPVVLGISPLHVYWKVCTMDNGYPILKNAFPSLFQHHINLAFPAEYHATMAPSLASETLEVVSDSGEVGQLRIKSFDYSFETPFEAVWRTLIADVWQGQHPAPTDAGLAFGDFIIEGMRKLLSRFQCIKAGRLKEVQEILGPMDYDQTVLSCFNNSSLAEASVVKECEKLWIERMEDFMILSSWEEVSNQMYVKSFPDRTPPKPVLPHIESTTDISSYKFMGPKDGHLEWSRQLNKEKFIFRTSTGNVGSASTTINTSDEIWVLAGSNFPCLLRHMQNGHYEFIGEAYVRGIMNGEALWTEGNPTFTDIILE